MAAECFRYGDRILVWDESYVGPERRYRFRRLEGGTRSGRERRFAGGARVDQESRRRMARRANAIRRLLEDRRLR